MYVWQQKRETISEFSSKQWVKIDILSKLKCSQDVEGHKMESFNFQT